MSEEPGSEPPNARATFRKALAGIGRPLAAFLGTVAAAITVVGFLVALWPSSSPSGQTSTTQGETAAPTTIPPLEVATLLNLIGQTEADATEILDDLGLDLGTVSDEVSQGPPGLVIGTDPKAGTVLFYGTTVDLTLAKMATPAQVYLAALFAVGIDDPRLEPRAMALWAVLGSFEGSVADHAARLESSFEATYENEPPSFVHTDYSPDTFGIDASDLRSDADKLAAALAALEVDPPREVADLHDSVVAEAQSLAATAGEIDELLSKERNTYPSGQRQLRRRALIIFGRDLAAIRMDLEQICVLLQPDHPDCESVVGDDPGPNPAVGVYLMDLREIGARVDYLDARSRVLQREWTSAEDLGDRSSYLTMLADEGLWRVLGYWGDDDTEAGVLQELAERLVVPDGSALSAMHQDLVTAVATARTAVEEMATSFLHHEPRSRERSLEDVPNALESVIDAIADTCNRTGPAYSACVS